MARSAGAGGIAVEQLGFEMEKTREKHGRRKQFGLAVGTSAAVAATMDLTAGTTTAATMTNVRWAVSNIPVGATGAQYTYNFTTATAATIGSITETVPAERLAPYGGRQPGTTSVPATRNCCICTGSP